MLALKDLEASEVQLRKDFKKCDLYNSSRLVHLDVEVRSEDLLALALLCHKEPARASKAPYAGSLWHKGAYNRTFQCIEACYPLCHKSKDPLGLCVPKPLVGGFGCPSWFFMA